MSSCPRSATALTLGLTLALGLTACKTRTVPNAKLTNPTMTDLAQPAPDSFTVRFETSKGAFTVRAFRAWSPRGVDRFYYLASNGYYRELTLRKVEGKGRKPRSSYLAIDPLLLYDRWELQDGARDDGLLAAFKRGLAAHPGIADDARIVEVHMGVEDRKFGHFF